MRVRSPMVLALVAGMAMVSVVPAHAHTEVQRAVPSPGEVVAGPIDSVELIFLDPVLPTVSIEVTAAGGDPVDGLGPVTHGDDGRSASVTFAPLSDAGDYVVDYEFVAIDGDAQVDAYRFSVAPPSDGDDRRSRVGLGALGLVGAALVFAVVAALRRRGTVA